MSGYDTHPATLATLERCAAQLREDNPGRRVVVDHGAVWIDGGNGTEYGIFSAVIGSEPGTVVRCMENGATVLHRCAACGHFPSGPHECTAPRAEAVTR